MLIIRFLYNNYSKIKNINNKKSLLKIYEKLILY
jgi:hypothetical protein